MKGCARGKHKAPIDLQANHRRLRARVTAEWLYLGG